MRVIVASLAIGAVVAGAAFVEVSAQSTGAADQAPATEVLENEYSEAESFRRGTDRPVDLAEALRRHAALADVGYGPSLHRMGDFYYYGEAVPRDLDRAAELYGQAYEAGSERSLTRQGRTLRIMGGREAEAFEVLTRAAELGLSGAARELAQGHIDAQFGAQSDPAAGIAILEGLLAEDADDTGARFMLADAYREGTGVERNMARARELYEVNAAAGHVRSAERLARMLERGQGGPADKERAVELYRLAIADGRTGSYDDLAELLSDLGRGPEALEVLNAAVDEGIEGARLDRAIGHYTRLFGDASDREFGAREIQEISTDPTSREAREIALLRARIVFRRPVDMDAVLGVLNADAADGDMRAVETLLRLYRDRTDMFPDHIALREDLMARHGDSLDREDYVRELVHLTYDKAGDAVSARPLVRDIVNSAGPDTYEEALYAAWRADKNAYLYVLQSLFREAGRYDGPLDGWANDQTIAAILAYCEEHGYADQCIHGPASTDTVKLMIPDLAEDRFGG